MSVHSDIKSKPSTVQISVKSSHPTAAKRAKLLGLMMFVVQHAPHRCCWRRVAGAFAFLMLEVLRTTDSLEERWHKAKADMIYIDCATRAAWSCLRSFIQRGN